MKQKNTITILVLIIVAISAILTSIGIFSNAGQGSYLFESIHGKTIEIYGKGIYQHMSSDVAIQGIAQDFVTLFIGIPLLLVSLCGFRKNSMKSHFMLSGTLGYFFVTYLFYTAMGMYNLLFLGWVALLGLSFFGLMTSLLSFDLSKIEKHFSNKTPTKFVGGFLIFTSVLIAMLWLSIVVSPLIDGTIYPESLQHFTTLIVQGFDLGLLLPISFISGVLLIKRKKFGYLFGTTYIGFLSILMTALTAKIIAMSVNGVNVIPAVFVIPSFNIIAILSLYLMIKNIKGEIIK